MPDPFQNVSSAGPDFIATIAQSLEARGADPAMQPIIGGYLDGVDWSRVCTALEIGCGTGALSRRIADRAPKATVRGIEPSPELVAHAETLRGDRPNLAFAVGDGAALIEADESADLVLMHTVLSHVTDPAALLREAHRVLKPGATLVVCDGDFSKASLAIAADDPLHVVATHFARNFVTDPYLVGRLRGMLADAGFAPGPLNAASRLVADTTMMAVWVTLSCNQMVEEGVIGRPLADALMAEHDRRLDAGQLYGFQVFATILAVKR